MSICERCIHDYVCGLEDNHEEGIVSCVDRIPKDVLDKIRAEIEAIAINGQVDIHTAFIRTGEQVKQMALDIIDKYKAEGSE